MAELLLEIGTEELPAAAAPSALAQLAERLPALLADLRLEHGAATAFGTPRRLALRVAGVAERQPDLEEWVRGPSRAVGFGPDGAPSRAALGFARGQGVDPSALEIRPAGGGEYLFALRRTPGRPAGEVLAERLPALIAGIDFPRSMRWGEGDLRFGRPIRWIVALLDSDTVPFVLGELSSGRTTHGHRTLAPGPVEVASASAYEAAMATACVMADPAARAEHIRAGVAAAAAPATARIDEGLLAEVNWLVEHPTPFLGEFPKEALAVPEPILIEVMRVQQRYFPVRSPEGRLAAQFCGVRDGNGEHLATVIAGNERVLRARFADARFFYDEDRKRTLASRVPELGRVTFAEGLGDMGAKVARLARLVSGPTAQRAAHLCKADRLTHLVDEFPELEGTMGAHYAQLDGEPADVCQAIGEHVLPRAAGGDLPQSQAGRDLALGDRLDNLAGHFLLGRVPTGSADPFGLRRQAIAVLRILRERSEPDLGQAMSAAIAGYSGVGDPAAASREVRRFLRERLRGLMIEAGHRYDLVDAVLGAEEWRVGELWARLASLEAILAEPALADDFLTVYRRCANLATKADPDAKFRLEGASAAEEEALGRALLAAPHLEGLAHARAVASLRPAVDALLDRVLIVAPEPAVRANRLALLRDVAAFAARFADLGRVVA